MANKANVVSVPGVDSLGNAVDIVNAAVYPRSSKWLPSVQVIPCTNAYEQIVRLINAALFARSFIPEPYYSISTQIYEVWGIFEFGPGYVDQHYLASWYLENLPQPVVYSHVSGLLPPGLVLSNIGSTAQGQIEGVPSIMGSYDFELRALGPSTDSTKLFTINIGEGGDQSSYLYGN